MPGPGWFRNALCAAILACASPAGADTTADMARAKRALAEVTSFDSRQVNRLGQAQRSAIWTQYYLLLEHYGRMRVHHEMISRHDFDRAQAFAAEEARFVRALAELQLLLHENLE